ncbi:protein OCTOPUS-like, partial [Bidens hawaiensis]|uniref:protein OCTOPUS-like n=1 Tax=Bidens hawaiensis TaxID=980011 RepID=UPI004049EAD9
CKNPSNSDPDPHTRTSTRTRRRSSCHRHPNEPVIGLCALCLRDRLSGLDTSADHIQTKNETIVSIPLSRRTRHHAGGSTLPELRRSKSVAVEKCEILNESSLDLRRNSCDVRASNRLTDLFGIDDDTKIGGYRGVVVESKNLGFLNVSDPVLEIIEDREDSSSEIRMSNDEITRNEIDNYEIEEEQQEEDLRTMKEHIEMELELQNRKKNIWEAASVFSLKLRKWRIKHKEKKQTDNNININNNNNNNDRLGFSRFKDSRIELEVGGYALGRRSCDAAPRVSVEDSQFTYDEHRASWDGYMIARTIPRLTPMLPIVDDLILPPVNKMVTVKEEGSSSKSNSDSCSSNTGSSSSSMKSSSSCSKTAGFEGNLIRSVSRRNDIIGQETKVVITEREFNDWHLESASNARVSNCGTVKNGWKKVSNLWSYKSKHSDKKNDGYSRNKTELYPNGEEGGRRSVSDIESGLMRLHFGKSRKNLARPMATDG